MKNKRNDKGNSPSGTIKVLPLLRVEQNDQAGLDGQHKLINLSFDPTLLSEMIIQLFPGQYA